MNGPEVVFTKSAPKTGFSEGTESPIAQGVKVGGFLFVSGQGPLDPVSKQIVSSDIVEQTRVTLDNVKAVLEAGGTAIAHVVRVGVYLRDMKDFPAFNRVCSRSTSAGSSPPAPRWKRRRRAPG
jgi:2-iminobutanoate/2-iminopropanoate deaminase